MALLLSMLTLAGLVGGAANRLREIRDGLGGDGAKGLDRFAVAAYPYVLSVAASWCVPLFLSLTKSSLLDGAPERFTDLLIVFGLAVLAALGASNFLDRLSKHVLDALKDAGDAKQKAAEAEETAEQANALAEEAVQSRAQLAAPKAQEDTLLPDPRTVLDTFRRNGRWAPSMRGLMRELGWDESRVRGAMVQLVSSGWLRELETTPTRKWIRWTLTA